ncbi:hypothetical protein VCHA50P416_170093 [Vibrio chagasii]|nr:hypothetical protein VCHA42P256_170016 [Vibrio chagasii]CAH7003622.1 hypothetical protein VCHA43P272_190096 [Vibrio chagasii]CAH7202990.1 hypothetical protein VCHA50P416_170093 [Vibrio chagasii]
MGAGKNLPQAMTGNLIGLTLNLTGSRIWSFSSLYTTLSASITLKELP